MPISWRGTLQQYVGRLHRDHDGKQVVQVYDYVDVRVPMLMRMYERRVKGYKAIGYSFEGQVAGQRSETRGPRREELPTDLLDGLSGVE